MANVIPKMDGYSRRQFLKNTAVVGAMLPMVNVMGNVGSKIRSKDDIEVHVFSKHLQFLNYEKMAEQAKALGFDGIDLTVRPKGHVLPENVGRDLPKAVKAIRSTGLLSTMMTTRIENVDEDHIEAILQAASELELKYYRTGYFSYRKDSTIPEDIKHYQKQAVKLSKLNAKYDLVGCYQNHAGTRMGASIWELYNILEKVKNDHYRVQFDIRHAVVEGGLSWENGLRLIAPKIETLVLKDFKWGQVKGKWRPINTTFGEGMVDFKSYFKWLKANNINVPMSMHFEYELGGANHGAFKIDIPPHKVYSAMQRDLDRARELWASV